MKRQRIAPQYSDTLFSGDSSLTQLWAPWRYTYFKQLKRRGCVLCAIAKKPRNDKCSYVVYRSQRAFSVLNIFPYNNGHCMICPVRHVKNIEDLSAGEWAQLHSVLIKTKKALNRILHPEGYNIGINLGKVSGAGIHQHLHIHIVPRWYGDTNFMPVTAHTKIISQSLDALYCELKKVI